MRIVLLLSIFFVILFGTWLTEKRMAAWDRPILVTVYPLVADGAPATAADDAESADEPTDGEAVAWDERAS